MTVVALYSGEDWLPELYDIQYFPLLSGTPRSGQDARTTIFSSFILYLICPKYAVILLIAMAILAYVTDAGMVSGYDRYQNSFAFFWFRINHLLRQQKLRVCKKDFYQEKSQFVRACQYYEEAVNNHNQRFENNVKFVSINIYFDDVYIQQFYLSGKASNNELH
ncbi:MAG: hypothetical protein F6K54_28365 [Okeania sp. SIO3B5]|uniref:hypothetical protein n=1 Tax=Okeania sp. SIO3B5 TaxID=2607811 RepID=UPI0013FEADB3|nr:hypothetical protein [Okeania sp. SIO3B5]NEO56645.1 hypothetical protein [Okeania sp. SIO3B5]